MDLVALESIMMPRYRRGYTDKRDRYVGNVCTSVLAI